MNRKFAIFAALIAAFAFTSQAAQAHGDKKKLAAVAIAAGAASTVGYFALNNWSTSWNSNGTTGGLTRLGAYGAVTLGCAAVSPMVATVVLKRPLTMREAHVLVGSCVVPIVGGLLVNAVWDAHPQWEAGAKPVRHAHHKKKMK